MTLSTGQNLGLVVDGAFGEEHYDALMRQWRGLDTLVQPRAIRFASAPPVNLVNGDVYIIGSAPSGIFAGKAGQIARWSDSVNHASGWDYFVPKEGWTCYVSETGFRYTFKGGVWTQSADNGTSETPTLLTEGGVPSLAVDSTNALNSLFAKSLRPFISLGDYLTPLLKYPTGRFLTGIGRLFKNISGGRQQLNSYGDQIDASQYISNREYMVAFHKFLMMMMLSPSRKLRIAYGGDSTTEGASLDGGASSLYTLSNLHIWQMTRASMQTPAGTDVFNLGHSGWSAEQWRQSSGNGGSGANYGLQRALALDLDAIVLSLGINEPGFNKDGSAMPPNAGQDAAGRRDIGDLEASMRGILTALRAQKNFNLLTIILAIPNSVSDTPNGRDERWLEQVGALYRVLAREFACVLIDKYAYLRDSRRAAAGGWGDDIVTPGSGNSVHLLEIGNLWISELHFEVFYPQALRLKFCPSGIQSVAGVQDVGDASRLPDQYHYGVTISRALNGGFPSTGNVVTIRSPDETVLQIFYPFDASETYYMAFRHGISANLGGQAKGWYGSWKLIGGTSTNVSPSGPFVIGVASNDPSEAMRVASQGDTFVLTGCVSLTNPIAVSNGTQVATLPSGSAPGRCAVYTALATLYMADGTFIRNVVAQVRPNGAVIVDGNSGGASVKRVYVDATWSRLP